MKTIEKKYQEVIDRLNVDGENAWLRERILAQLKDELHKRTISLIWKYMTDDQVAHFNDFAQQSSVVSPELSDSQVLIDFALLYDDLVAKVSDDLDLFVEEFVAKVNG